MDALITLVVVAIFAIIAFVVIRFIVGTVATGADIAMLVRLGRDLKNPQTSPDRLRSITREIGAILLTGKDEREARALLAQTMMHPRTDATLKEWLVELRRALDAQDHDAASKMIWAGPPPQGDPAG